jgi:hypothetical protein
MKKKFQQDAVAVPTQTYLLYIVVNKLKKKQSSYSLQILCWRWYLIFHQVLRGCFLVHRSEKNQVFLPLLPYRTCNDFSFLIWPPVRYHCYINIIKFSTSCLAKHEIKRENANFFSHFLCYLAVEVLVLEYYFHCKLLKRNTQKCSETTPNAKSPKYKTSQYKMSQLL